MQAVILAAGSGTRMRPHTDDLPKPLLEIAGRSLLDRALDALAGMAEVTVVTGYRAAQLEEHLQRHWPSVRVVHNPRYRETNNLHSLGLALGALDQDDDLLLLEGDVLFGPEVLSRLTASPQANVALVAPYRPGMDGTVVRLEQGRVTQLIPAAHQQGVDLRECYKTLNIYRFSSRFVRATLRPWLEFAGHAGSFYELVLGLIIYAGAAELHAEVIADEPWAELDDPHDLARARQRWSDGRLEALGARCGGLWHEDVLDFCYLRNVHFPTPGMRSELRAHLDTLIESYGSRQQVLDARVAELLGCAPERVTTLNGASQAFPWLGELWGGRRVLLPTPTFGEYSRWFPQALTYSDRVGFAPGEIAAQLAAVELAVFVNPNNPTGSVLPSQQLIEWARAHPQTSFLVDESFADFAGQPGVLELGAPPNLTVLKSLGKSLGVPGLRLGLLYGADQQLRARLPIWSNNSVAEFFLELALKQREALAASFRQTCADRQTFARELAAVPGVAEVYPSAANFLLLRLEGAPGREVADRLLAHDNLFVKDVSERFEGTGHLRVGVRSRDDNRRLVRGLRAVLESLALT